MWEGGGDVIVERWRGDIYIYIYEAIENYFVMYGLQQSNNDVCNPLKKNKYSLPWHSVKCACRHSIQFF